MRAWQAFAKCRCQRQAVVQLPLLAARNAGVTITTCGFSELIVMSLLVSSLDPSTPAQQARQGNAAELAAALRESRRRTLSLLDAFVVALGDTLAVPYSPQINPPLWEAGHIAWFQDYWIARNPQRQLGIACDPEHDRAPGRLPQADTLYDSSRIAHAKRWHLPLPELAATRDYLANSLADTLALLASSAETETEASLYFYRLVLMHEDMHAEAAIYMAQALGIALPADLFTAPPSLPENRQLMVPGQRWQLGHSGPGFAFDNELNAHPVEVAGFSIDSQVVSWRRYLEISASKEGRLPRYLRQRDGIWQTQYFGVWQPLDLDRPAVHLTWQQADDWCRRAGRRLPLEAEWELAALTQPDFAWGSVWEWTASRFLPYPGFVAHPYRDYSAPWFGDRYVLRGASTATSPHMRHPRYRNFFTPDRNDLHNGFRSCAR